MRLLCLAGMLFLLSGCFNNHSSLTSYQQSPRTDQNLADNYKASESPSEEYVNRVAKRIMVVSNRPYSKYIFVVQNDNTPRLELDTETNTVTISMGALRELQDEAELAATLTMSMERLDNTPYFYRSTVDSLYMADYDPRAVLELQEQYISAAVHGEHWLQALFPDPPSSQQIAETKNLVEKMPKGLQRGAETYTQQING